MDIQNWNYDGNFLEAFEPKRRSLISNMFCNAVRRGKATTGEVIDFVRADALKRLDISGCYYPGEAGVIKSLELLLSVLETSEAWKYAEFIIKRESLPSEQKAKLKRESGIDYAKAAMQEQSPTEKQLSYLKSLGCLTVPKTKLEAMELINKMLEQKKVSA